MKINITRLKTVPKEHTSEFELCYYGQDDAEITAWANNHKLASYKSGDFTNIKIPKGTILSELFNAREKYGYLDGFSPNISKHLHIGHFSNLVLAKAFQSLGIANKNVSILGDTLTGEVSKEEALKCLLEYCQLYGLKLDEINFASEIVLGENIMADGTGEYEGTKIFDIEGDKVVGIKSSGQTSYFYQDVALAQKLNSSTLYLTGKEQTNHFGLIKKLFPNTHHIGLGLVKAEGKKMSSSVGNVIFMKDLIEQFGEEFHTPELIYNVFAGFILKSAPSVDKKINLDHIANPKNSAGLYISYTMARLHSAGMSFEIRSEIVPSFEIEMAYLKSKETLSPHFLFAEVGEVCKKVNGLYLTHIIKGNEANQGLFKPLLSDILWGCKKLGLFPVSKV